MQQIQLLQQLKKMKQMQELEKHLEVEQDSQWKEFEKLDKEMEDKIKKGEVKLEGSWMGGVYHRSSRKLSVQAQHFTFASQPCLVSSQAHTSDIHPQIGL